MVKYLPLISGILFAIAGISYIFTLEHPVGMFMGALFMLGGFVNLLTYFYLPKEAMISWDNEKLVYSGQQITSKTFLLKDIYESRVEEHQLILKSDAHRGTILDIKGFSKTDIEKLEEVLFTNRKVRFA